MKSVTLTWLRVTCGWCTASWLLSWCSRLWLTQGSHIITFLLVLLWVAEQKRNSWLLRRGSVSRDPKMVCALTGASRQGEGKILLHYNGSSMTIKVFQKHLSTHCWSSHRYNMVSVVVQDSLPSQVSSEGVSHGNKTAQLLQAGVDAQVTMQMVLETPLGRGQLCRKKWCLGADKNSQDEAWTCQRWLERASDGWELGSKRLPPPRPRGKEIIFIR